MKQEIVQTLTEDAFLLLRLRETLADTPPTIAEIEGIRASLEKASFNDTAKDGETLVLTMDDGRRYIRRIWMGSLIQSFGKMTG